MTADIEELATQLEAVTADTVRQYAADVLRYKDQWRDLEATCEQDLEADGYRLVSLDASSPEDGPYSSTASDLSEYSHNGYLMRDGARVTEPSHLKHAHWTLTDCRTNEALASGLGHESCHETLKRHPDWLHEWDASEYIFDQLEEPDPLGMPDWMTEAIGSYVDADEQAARRFAGRSGGSRAALGRHAP